MHAKARAKGVELPKAATAARVGHRVGRAEDVAHVQARFGMEEGRHGVKVFKRALCRFVRGSFIGEVKGSREGVRLKNNAREVTEEGMEGRNGSNQCH